MKKIAIVILVVFGILVLSICLSPLFASEGVVGQMEVTAVPGEGIVRVEGSLLDGVSNQPASGFVSGILIRGGNVMMLENRKVSGNFNFRYQLKAYRRAMWRITLYSDEVDADGKNIALIMKSGMVR